MAALRQSL